MRNKGLVFMRIDVWLSRTFVTFAYGGGTPPARECLLIARPRHQYQFVLFISGLDQWGLASQRYTLIGRTKPCLYSSQSFGYCDPFGSLRPATSDIRLVIPMLMPGPRDPENPETRNRAGQSVLTSLSWGLSHSAEQHLHPRSPERNCKKERPNADSRRCGIGGSGSSGSGSGHGQVWPRKPFFNGVCSSASASFCYFGALFRSVVSVEPRLATSLGWAPDSEAVAAAPRMCQGAEGKVWDSTPDPRSPIPGPLALSNSILTFPARCNIITWPGAWPLFGSRRVSLCCTF